MVDENSELLRKMVDLLRQIVDQQQRDVAAREATAKAIGTHDFTKQQDEHKREMTEIKANSERWRREEMEYRAALLTAFQELTDVLHKVIGRLEKSGPEPD